MNNPIGILKFNLDDSEQATLFEDSFKGPRYKVAIDDLYQEVFRPCIKYGKSFKSNTEADEYEHELVQLVWEQVNEYFKGCGIE